MDEKMVSEVRNTLNDSTKKYIDKVGALLLGWKHFYSVLSNKSSHSCVDLLNYLVKCTQQYLLHGEWTQLDDALRIKFTIILHKLLALPKTDQEASRRLKLIIKLIHEPWKNSTLHKILHSQSPTDKEVCDYICTEGSELLLMRLEVLCEGKCEDLAFKLVSTILKHLSANKELRKSDVDNISDALLVLLFRFKRNKEIIEKLKTLDLMEGLDLVKRFASRKSCTTGLWKFCDKVTEIAAHTILATVMVQNVESKERQKLLYELVNEWALIHIPKLTKCLSTLCNMVRKIIQKAESPIHVYIIAQVLHKQLGDQVKPLCIELYIRGFTSNINLIEHYKSCNDIEKTLNAEILLSNSFLELSELLEDNIIIHKECVLTAFSLHPTKECLTRLEKAASLCCKDCRNLDKLSTVEENSVIKNDCDNISCAHAKEKTEEPLIEAVNTLNILNSDLLGLAPHLCDDLSTVLCSPRSQTLSWSLGWSRLKKQCEKYLSEHFDRKSQKSELKYLNIDYSKFENYSSKNSYQTHKRVYKPKPGKVYDSDSEVFIENKTSYRNLSNNQRMVTDKNAWNDSIMKINNILNEGYTNNKPVSSSSKAVFGRNIDSNNKFISSNNIDALRFLTGSYYSKYRTVNENNLKNVPSRQNNIGESISNRGSYPSPKIGDVPSVNRINDLYQERLVPLINSVRSDSIKQYHNSLISKKVKYNLNYDFREKPKLDGIVKGNFPQSSLSNDKLLTKYIPGMNSLDLIVPLRPEPTVQVVQIPSPNIVLQPVSSNSSSTIQTNNTSITIAKPLTESVSTQSTESVTTHTQTSQQHSLPIQTSHTSTNNSNLLLTTVVNPGSLSRIHGPDRHTSLISQGVMRTQNKSTGSSNTSESVNISSEPGNSVINVTTHEGSTQVTAHIQRIGQPNKQKILVDETTNSLKTSQNTNSHIPSTVEVFEDQVKHSQTGSIAGSIYRFILKDGKIVEQYCQTSQNSPYSMQDTLNESNIQNPAQENVIQHTKIKTEPINEDTSNSDNMQVPSLPQFHQAFRRQVYQSGSVIEGSSINSSSRKFSEDSVENKKQERHSSPLSKAVQTVLKDAETSTKGSEKLSEESISPTNVQSTTPVIKQEDVQVSDLPSSSGVIFTCKVPISMPGNTVLQTKPVPLLKTANPQEILKRAPQQQDSEPKNKDSVIRSNMNALLAAALQNNPVKTSSSDSSTSNTIHSMKQNKIATQELKSDNSSMGTNKLRMPSPTQKNVRRPPVVQTSSTSRFSRPVVHSSSINTSNQNVPPVVTIPVTSRSVQVLATNSNQSTMTNMSKADNRRDQISTVTTSTASTSTSPEQRSVSSTTLEQLREFESVLEQVTNTSQMKERGNTTKPEPPEPSTSSNSDFPPSSSPKVNTLFQTSLANAISDVNNENRVNLTFISKASTTCTNTLISGTSPKISNTTPVVVVQSCSRPLASPSLSVASQSSPGSSPSTPPSNSQSKISPKIAKPKIKTSIGKTAPTTTLKVSTIPKPQQKPQEDEQTTQRIYAILDKYAEQLRNSPELKNKPAPRRRSNPPTNPSNSNKRKKSSQNKAKSFSNVQTCTGVDMSPGSEDLRTGGSEDSSNGVNQVTQTGSSPHSRCEELSNQGPEGSSDLSESAEKERLQHRILLADQSGASGRTVIVQDNVQPVISVEGTKVLAGKQLVVGGSATVPLTLQLPGTGNVKQVLFPVPADGRPFVVAKVPKMYRFHQVTMPSGSPLIATNSSGTVLLRQMCLNKSSSTLKQVKLPVVSQISTQLASQPTVVLPSGSQSFTLSAGSPIDSESLGIALDNTILLNSASTPTSSIGFIQRNLPKSSQTSTIYGSLHQITETSTSSSGTDLPTIKTENTVIKTENLSCETSRSSDQCDMEIKTEDVKYAIESNLLSDRSHKGASLISTSSTNNNWVQVLKDAGSSSSILNKMHEVEEKNMTRKDSLEGCDHFEKQSEKKYRDEAMHSNNEPTHMKHHKLVDASSYTIEGMNDSKSVVNPHLNDHWQFNIKLEKVCNSIKSEPLSPSLREPSKDVDSPVHQSHLSQSQGMKRKVENTIFQIAFKRDKVKLAKEEFIQQRNPSAMERELRLQKSLSEECEDLGVDKPSTSDLFPEAELLLDPDPLSRDSLHCELFSRGESSSSSLSSPNHSPIFSSKCTNSWKNHKRSVLNRHKYNYSRCSSPKKNVSDKTDSSRESTPINVNSSSSKCTSYDGVKSSESNFIKCISKDNSCINECVLREAGIQMDSHDSDACNFSDVDDHNDTDLLDTEGDSDDFLQNQRDCKHSYSLQSGKDPEDSKCSESPLLRRLSGNSYSKGDYYLNKDSREKRNSDNSPPWFQMMKGIHRDTLEVESERHHHSCVEDINETHNGVLEEFEDQQDTMNNFVSNKMLQVRKRKKVGLFLTSQSEDSESSVDTFLAGSDSCSDFHDNLSKRSTIRGRVKKGCPCFNGSPEPNKKKKDLLPVLDKTDKPCSTKTLFSFSNKKPVSKSNIKFVNRKR